MTCEDMFPHCLICVPSVFKGLKCLAYCYEHSYTYKMGDGSTRCDRCEKAHGETCTECDAGKCFNCGEDWVMNGKCVEALF